MSIYKKSYLTPKYEFNEKINLDEYDEYYLIKENNAYKFIIETNHDELIIRHKYYIINMNVNDLSFLTKCKFNTINDAYQYIINIFEQNKVIIKQIEFRKTIKLLLKIYIYNIEKYIEIILLYNKENIINDKNDISKLKSEINILNKEINEIKNINDNKRYMNNIKIINKPYNNQLINYTNPENIEFSNIITRDCGTDLIIDNSISVFKSNNNMLLLIYGNKNNSIISLNLINKKIIQEIKNAHNKLISNIRHYLDSINKRDLILSISHEDNNLKIWDITFNCLVNLNNINNKGSLYSGMILNNNNQNYIVTSNYIFFSICEPIKIFDFKGNKINEIKNSNNNTFVIETYYDNNINKNYIHYYREYKFYYFI